MAAASSTRFAMRRATVAVLAALVQTCGGFAATHAPRPKTTLAASDDSWAVELQQAAGGAEEKEAASWLKGKNAGVDNSERARNDALMAWLTDNDVWVSELSGWNVPPHSMALATTTFDELEGEDSGRGLLARRAITQDAELIRLPVRLCMTKASALKARELRGSVNDDTNEYIAIALLLILERSKGPKSFWSEYIAILPTNEDVGATFTWPAEELAYLEGSPAASATASMMAKLRAEHAAVLEGNAALDPEIFTFEAWQWAFTNLFSRAIRLKASRAGELLAMVPYVDFINHSPFSSSYVDAREVPKAFPWEEKEDEVVLFADRAYKKFEQVFISYGPKSNADLLLLYGFALDRNPFNSVDLAVGASKDDALYDAKERFARGAGRDVSSAAFPLYADRFPDELVQFLRMACATEDHLGARPLDDPDNYVDILSLDNELAVLDTIRDACDAAVAAYPAKSGDDVPDAFLSRNQRMAKRLVNTEKRILLKTIAAVERKSNELLAAPSFAFERRQPDVLSNFK